MATETAVYCDDPPHWRRLHHLKFGEASRGGGVLRHAMIPAAASFQVWGGLEGGRRFVACDDPPHWRRLHHLKFGEASRGGGVLRRGH